MHRNLLLLLFTGLPLLIDLYIYQGVKLITLALKPGTRIAIHSIYWGFTAFTIGMFLVYGLLKLGFQGRFFKYFFIPFFFVNYFAKLFTSLFLLLDDITRTAKWGVLRLTAAARGSWSGGIVISRSAFLTKAGMFAATVPIVTMGYGILLGAHDYRVRRVKVKLPHLPNAFHGLRIGQLSDIHSGSFFNKTAVQGGVAMLVRERPDIIFFTGDLVNDRAEEMDEYLSIFSKIRAPLGVYSTLGNHDYGDYIMWPSAIAKRQNFRAICKAHELLGWRLLMNEHHIITQGTDKLAIIGVENWGTGRFAKYGRLDKAYQGTESSPVKLLLSHDPSHWDAVVRPQFKDIDITFSHTHGFQFGVEIGSFRWSPAQYIYKQWAGLYQEGHQYLYVNRGFGYIGYPGRIGILPELTILELEKG